MGDNGLMPVISVGSAINLEHCRVGTEVCRYLSTIGSSNSIFELGTRFKLDLVPISAKLGVSEGYGIAVS